MASFENSPYPLNTKGKINTTNIKQTDNRRSLRGTLRLPIQIEWSESDSSSARIFFGYTYDINSHGIGIQIASKGDIKSGTELVLNIDSHDDFQSLKLPTSVVWYSNSYCGLQFNEDSDTVQE